MLKHPYLENQVQSTEITGLGELYGTLKFFKFGFYDELHEICSELGLYWGIVNALSVLK